MIDAWASAFGGVSNITIRGGNVLLARTAALVSPANSFGFMDGGLNWTISELFEWKIQPIVQNVIRTKHNGELLVGQAEVLETRFDTFPYLICAPTMRVPQNVASTVNAFLAMRAILTSIQQYNRANDNAIGSVAIPGLCTGAGQMPYERCATQMRTAYDYVTAKELHHFTTLSEAIAEEIRLKK